MFGFIARILVGLLLSFLAYLIMPKPKPPKPPEARDMEDPTADAGREVPVVFGSMTIKGSNIIWFGDKSKRKKKIKGGSKK